MYAAGSNGNTRIAFVMSREELQLAWQTGVDCTSRGSLRGVCHHWCIRLLVDMVAEMAGGTGSLAQRLFAAVNLLTYQKRPLPS